MRRLPSADTTPEGGARFFDTFISPRYSLTSAGIITASINSRSAAGISSPPGRPFRSNLRTSAISFEITVADQAATRVLERSPSLNRLCSHLREKLFPGPEEAAIRGYCERCVFCACKSFVSANLREGFPLRWTLTRKAFCLSAFWRRSAWRLSFSVLYLRGRPPLRIALRSPSPLHSRLHQTPDSSLCVKRTAPSTIPHLSQISRAKQPYCARSS